MEPADSYVSLVTRFADSVADPGLFTPSLPLVAMLMIPLALMLKPRQRSWLLEAFVALATLVGACGCLAWSSRAPMSALLLFPETLQWDVQLIAKQLGVMAFVLAALVVATTVMLNRQVGFPLLAAAPPVVLISILGGYAFSVANCIPHGAICGPVSREFIIDANELESRELVVWAVTSAAVSLVALLVMLPWLAPHHAESQPSWRLRPAIVALGLGLLAASAFLMAEARPFFEETTLPQLPLNDDPPLSAQDGLSLPKLSGPELLGGAIVLRLKRDALLVRSGWGPEQVGTLDEIAAILKANRSEYAQREGARSSALLLVEPQLPSALVAAVLAQLPEWVDAIQLGFDVPTEVTRPVLGKLRVPHESGYTVSLLPKPGSHPIAFRLNETWGDFSKRALREGATGPLHLVLDRAN